MIEKPTHFTAIAMGADHRGQPLKDQLRVELQKNFALIEDFGTDGPESVDAMDYALKVVGALKDNPQMAGILICGSGVMMALTANRFPFIRAAVCRSAEESRYAREHNDANVLCMASDYIEAGEAMAVAETFLSTAA